MKIDATTLASVSIAVSNGKRQTVEAVPHLSGLPAAS